MKMIKKTTQITAFVTFLSLASANAGELELTLQHSIDLNHWESVNITEDMISQEGKIIIPAASQRGFFRMKIQESTGSFAPDTPQFFFENVICFQEDDGDQITFRTQFNEDNTWIETDNGFSYQGTWKNFEKVSANVWQVKITEDDNFSSNFQFDFTSENGGMYTESYYDNGDLLEFGGTFFVCNK